VTAYSNKFIFLQKSILRRDPMAQRKIVKTITNKKQYEPPRIMAILFEGRACDDYGDKFPPP